MPLPAPVIFSLIISEITWFFSGQHQHRRIPLKIYHLDFDTPGPALLLTPARILPWGQV